MDEERQQKVKQGMEKFAELRHKRKKLEAKKAAKNMDTNDSLEGVVETVAGDSVPPVPTKNHDSSQHIEESKVSSHSSQITIEATDLSKEGLKSSKENETPLKNVLDEYKKKITEYKDALSQRESLIQQLSASLQQTIADRDEGRKIADYLTGEVTTLKSQLQQSLDLITKQKQSSQASASELTKVKNDFCALEEKACQKDRQIKELQDVVETRVKEIEILQNVKLDLLQQLRVNANGCHEEKPADESHDMSHPVPGTSVLVPEAESSDQLLQCSLQAEASSAATIKDHLPKERGELLKDINYLKEQLKNSDQVISSLTEEKEHLLKTANQLQNKLSENAFDKNLPFVVSENGLSAQTSSTLFVESIHSETTIRSESESTNEHEEATSSTNQFTSYSKEMVIEEIRKELSEWSTCCKLECLQDFCDAFRNLKMAASQGSQYPLVVEELKTCKEELDKISKENAVLVTNITNLQEQLTGSLTELESLKLENSSLQKCLQSALSDHEQQMNFLGKEYNQKVIQVKEMEYKKGRDEAEEEHVLKMYKLQTECMQLEQAKTELEGRLGSSQIHQTSSSPSVKHVPSSRVPSDENSSYCDTFTQTELDYSILLRKKDDLIEQWQLKHDAVVRLRNDEALVHSELKQALDLLKKDNMELKTCLQECSSADKECSRLQLELTEVRSRLDVYKEVNSSEQLKQFELLNSDEIQEENEMLLHDKENLEIKIKSLGKEIESKDTLIKQLQDSLSENHSTLFNLIQDFEKSSGQFSESYLFNKKLLYEYFILKSENLKLQERLHLGSSIRHNLESSVLNLSRKNELNEKHIKDLRNKTNACRNSLRQALLGSHQFQEECLRLSMKVKSYEQELVRLKQHLGEHGISFENSVIEVESAAVTSESCLQDLKLKLQDLKLTLKKKESLLEELNLTLDLQQLESKNQELSATVTRELQLCKLQEELNSMYEKRLVEHLANVKDFFEEKMQFYQQDLMNQSTLKDLQEKEEQLEVIASLKNSQHEQMEQLLLKCRSQSLVENISSAEEECLKRLQIQQQEAYEQLNGNLNSEQKTKLQDLVSHTLQLHQLEKEISLKKAQECINSEKNCLLEFVTVCNQADRDALVASLEHDKQLALRQQLEDFLKLQQHSSESKIPRHKEQGDSAQMKDLVTCDFRDLVHVLKEKLKRICSVCLNNLQDAWKEKYLDKVNEISDLLNSSGVGENEEEFRNSLNVLKECLQQAEETHSLLSPVFSLCQGISAEVVEKLEEILHIYVQLDSESHVVNELTEFKSKCQDQESQLAKLMDDLQLTNSRHKLELEKLKAQLEEEHSDEKTQLCMEQVTRTKELLNKHQKEMDNLRISIEEQAAAEKKKLLTENELLRENLQQLQACREEFEAESLKIEAELSEEIRHLVEEHRKETEKLSCELQTALDQLQTVKQKMDEERQRFSKEKDSIVNHYDSFIKCLEEQHKSIVSEESDQNEKIKSDLLAAVKEREDLKAELDVVASKYEERIKSLEKKLENAIAEYESKMIMVSENHLTYQEVVESKNEKIEIFQTEIDQYKEIVASLKSEHEKEIKIWEERLQMQLDDQRWQLDEEHKKALDELQEKFKQELSDAKKDQFSESCALDQEEITKTIDALKSQIEQYEEEKQSILTDHELEKLKLINEHKEDIENLSREFAQKLKEVESNWLAVLQNQKESVSEGETGPELMDKNLQKQLKSLQDSVTKLQAEKAVLESQLNKEDKAGSSSLQKPSRHTAQTNSRLMNVLSDLVKTYVDTEQEIQDTLTHLGLVRHGSPDGSINLEDEQLPSLGGISQTHGSKEDFSIPIQGDGFIVELCEDGPDLTPRTWDIFMSAMGMQEVESGEEDVVLGASRRLRTAVERVLRLLTDIAECRGEDFLGVMQRNHDLSQELQDVNHAYNQLKLDLLKVEDKCKSLEQEKRKLEDEINSQHEDNVQITRELKSLHNKFQSLEEARQSLSEDQRIFEEQRKIFKSSLPEPQQNKGSSESEELLDENKKLQEEKRNLQHLQDNEKQQFLVRIGDLETVVEDVQNKKEEILEEKNREIADLKAQIEAMDKQLMSYKRFIEEQAHEREQEREEFSQELGKLQEIVKEKEKLQNSEDRWSKEVEALEQQLRTKMEEHKHVFSRNDNLETEVRNKEDRIHDLSEIIKELEKELDLKTQMGKEFLQNVTELKEELKAREKSCLEHTSELEQLRGSSIRSEVSEHVKLLEEQLDSRNQELEKMLQYQSLLQEFRAQVHSLEEKLESKIRQIDTVFPSLSLSTSPVPSEELSLSEGCEAHLRPLSADDIRDLSPSSMQWEELKRLEEKVETLAKAEEEVMKRNKELESQLRRFRKANEEFKHEKLALQDQMNKQLLEISSLKSLIEEHRHGLDSSAFHGSPIMQQLVGLKHELLREKELKEEFEQRLHMSRDEIEDLKIKLEAEAELVVKLQEDLEKLKAENDHVLDQQTKDESQRKLEALESELRSKNIIIHSLEERIQELMKEIKYLSKATELQNKEIVNMNTFQDELGGDSHSSILVPRKQLEKDFYEVQHMLDEKEEELNSLQQEAETQVILEAKVSSLEKDILEQRQFYEQKVGQLQQDLQKAHDLHEKDITNTHQRFEDMLQHNAKVQEDMRNEILELREKLINYIPKEEAESMLTRTVSREKENVQFMHQENVKLLEGSWNVRIAEERKKFEEEKLRELTGLEKRLGEEYNLKLENMKWQMQQEMQISADKERLKLSAEHQQMLQEAQKRWEEEKRVMRNIHSEEIKKALESARMSLQKIHSEELTFLKDSLRKVSEEEITSVKKQHEMELRELQETWQRRLERELNSLKCMHQVELQQQEEMFSQKADLHHEDIQYIQNLMERKIDEEIGKLQQLHFTEMSELKTNLEKRWEEDKEAFKASHEEQLKAMKQNKAAALEKLQSHLTSTYEEKLLQMQHDFDNKILLQKMHLQRQHEEELQALRQEMNTSLNDERNTMRKSKSEELDKQLKSFSSKYEQEKEELLNNHKKEVESLKHTLETQWQQEKQHINNMHHMELQRLEENFKRLTEMELTRQKRQHQQEVESLLRKLESEQKMIKEAYEGEMEKMACSHRQDLETVRELMIRSKRSPEKRSREDTPLSDATTSSGRTSSCAVEDGSQDSVLSPPIKKLLSKVYKEGLQVLSLTERQILQQHLSPSPDQASGHLRSEEHSPVREMSSPRPLVTDDTHQTTVLYQEIQELRNALKNENASHEDSVLQLQEQIRILNEQHRQSEWQLKTERDMHEFRFKQEKSRADELKNALETESSRTVDVSSQLEEQKSSYRDLELRFSNLLAEHNELKAKLEEVKQQVLRFQHNYEEERTHSLNLLNALEAERTHFSQLQVTLESERRRGKAVHERDQQIINELRESLLKNSSMSLRTPSRSMTGDMEKLRGAEITSVDSLELSPAVLFQHEEFDKISAKWDHERNVLQRSLQLAENEIVKLREVVAESTNINEVTSVNSSVHHLLHRLYWKYRRSESYRHALVYQKEYLLVLLKGFQATEDATLKLLSRMGVYTPPQSTSVLHRANSQGQLRPTSPLSRFRSVSRAIIAVHRMKFMVHKWKTAANVPSSSTVFQKVETAVRRVPLGSTLLSGNENIQPSLSPLPSISCTRKSSRSSIQSGGSTASSGTAHLRRPSPQHASYMRNSSSPQQASGNANLKEYVSRLEALHRQLGLDSQ